VSASVGEKVSKLSESNAVMVLLPSFAGAKAFQYPVETNAIIETSERHTRDSIDQKRIGWPLTIPSVNPRDTELGSLASGRGRMGCPVSLVISESGD
jgi:hypothetical protein